MNITAETLYSVCEETWPPARSWDHKGWTLRDGAGGGKRVSATTLNRSDALIEDAEMDMRKRRNELLFMIRENDMALDQILDDRGYDVVDPVNMYACETSNLTDVQIPPVTTFVIWEPLAIMEEIWAQGGIGPTRLNVMKRAKVRTAVLARWNEKPAGAAFAAVHNDVCMVHAVEVLPYQRRQGVAHWIMRQAAFWAQEQGAKYISVLCTKGNSAANGLYTSLGMDVVGQYHYRQLGV